MSSWFFLFLPFNIGTFCFKGILSKDSVQSCLTKYQIALEWNVPDASEQHARCSTVGPCYVLGIKWQRSVLKLLVCVNE